MFAVMPKKIVVGLLRDEIRRRNENLRQIMLLVDGLYMTENEIGKANHELKGIYRTQLAYIRQTGESLQETL